jgi:hypothetical protein
MLCNAVDALLCFVHADQLRQAIISAKLLSYVREEVSKEQRAQSREQRAES